MPRAFRPNVFVQSGSLAVILCAVVCAQDAGRLTLERLYHPTLRQPVVGTPGTQLAWLADGVLQETRVDRRKRTVDVFRVDPKSGETAPLVDAQKVTQALSAAGAPADALAAAVAGGGFVWSDIRDAFVLDIGGDLFYMSLAMGKAQRLTNRPGEEEEATFSPSGTMVAFVRANDIYVSNVADGVETRLTQNGSPTQLNGKLDWVYQEEIYGRGNWKGYWWSPDSKAIAYLSLDESKVPAFTVLDHRTLHQDAHTAAYPKVGDPNPLVKLGVVAAAGGPTVWTKIPQPLDDALIVNVGWTPDARLQAQVQNRAQTWLELRTFASDGESSVVIRETTKAWVERLEMPLWLKDGSFLWESDRDGRHHVYRVAADGKLLNAVTAGAWDVRKVHGVDARQEVLYFSGTERSAIGEDVYRVALDGTKLKRLTEAAGTHSQVRFSPDFRYFVEMWSDVNTPAQQSIRDNEGKLVRVVDANESPAWAAVKKARISFQQVQTHDGFPMETMLMLPPDLDPEHPPEGKKFPVLCFIYGGPSTPMVKNMLNRYVLFHTLLCQEGYIVWVCDNRSASGKGWGSAWGVWKNMGEQELADQLEGLAWLRQKPFVDSSRVGIWGWSYGGYMTLYSLTHSDQFKMGIAGAPVTDWRLYDSIYTERYMGLLSENEAGYVKCSPLGSVANLSGKLLVLHGTMDDNVHPQNTLRLLDEIQRLGKSCELMLLPGSDHSPRTPPNQWGQYKTMYDFIKREL